MLRIGLIGEYNPATRSHPAIPLALAMAAGELAAQHEIEWIETPRLEQNAARQLAGYRALWFVPNTPYASMEGALHAITYAREHQIPTLGTCGGCQYMLIEYARTVLELHEADHAEDHPNGSMLLITPLACSNTGLVTTCSLTPGSRVARAYGTHIITEQYGTCNYGPNAEFWPVLEHGGLYITGKDQDGLARIVEIDQHPFFIGTLFQPELSAYNQVVHPLIRAFLKAAKHTLSAQA